MKWSPSQRRSGYKSPKNPYRVTDYNKVDPEYGTFEDWKAFSEKAHALGMKVFLDLVYVHCGPNCVLKDMYPDAFQRNADGTVKMTRWRFSYINFESRQTRKYLVDSMLFWMRNGADGFRCDSGDMVPMEFWDLTLKEPGRIPDMNHAWSTAPLNMISRFVLGAGRTRLSF